MSSFRSFGPIFGGFSLCSLLSTFFFHLFAVSASPVSSSIPSTAPTGDSVIFIHPDGAGVAHWNMHRLIDLGPDGRSNWDALPGVSVYLTHMLDYLSASSHGGATVHAYGRKVVRNSFGKNGTEPLVSASGFNGTIMQEAQAAGIAVGVINTGHLAEPGTAVMLASVPSRSMRTEVARQLVYSGADLIFGGGERLFLPKNVTGVHGKKGVRTDGRNLVEEARELGYTVLFTREDLKRLEENPTEATKVLGLFAPDNTYNDKSEETLRQRGLELYREDAPTAGEMLSAALAFFEAKGRPFFLMLEEEGTDNFANVNNARGTLEAVRRSDEAIGIAYEFVNRSMSANSSGTGTGVGRVSLIVTADSEAGVPALIETDSEDPVLASVDGGPVLHGSEGPGTRPFASSASGAGQSHFFNVAFASRGDHFGSVLLRSSGPVKDRIPATVDNTEVFGLIRETLLADDKEKKGEKDSEGP
uniref:alkaline phosphatase n=1 Tax=Chromera velia CCMP2878 TaxID=1169474 RepID=A0A0G4HS38_9ALVE|eukprot:Cvel_8196.t1-p1 / transcript=Cvel_8196.t1 / gene=Cvel_8196 / organism=Chromera_velia_CCMP2878 / gene_product=Alkaline phosphatase, putative / transcript_product=Alkaline phosphatase, putative / location=Cvel_scaffold447:1838-3253(-) / protein_length=472 / sequence_SO=supercontig / SO=protein_coding / is_pseudo=false